METIFWDFDGTLGYRKNGMFSDAMFEVLKNNVEKTEFGKEIFSGLLNEGFFWHTPEISHTHLNNNSNLWWEEMNIVFKAVYKKIGLSEIKANEISKLVKNEYIKKGAFVLYDDVLETLSYFHEKNYEQLILSNHVPELSNIVDELNLNQFIKATINSAHIGYEKPNPRAFELAMEYTQNKKENIWMIGDSYVADIMGAENIGIKAIQVRSQRNGKTKYYAKHLLELKDILDKNV